MCKIMILLSEHCCHPRKKKKDRAQYPVNVKLSRYSVIIIMMIITIRSPVFFLFFFLGWQRWASVHIASTRDRKISQWKIETDLTAAWGPYPPTCARGQIHQSVSSRRSSGRFLGPGCRRLAAGPLDTDTRGCSRSLTSRTNRDVETTGVIDDSGDQHGESVSSSLIGQHQQHGQLPVRRVYWRLLTL